VLARRVAELDFDEIGKWFEVRGKKMPDTRFFPKVGFIVPDIACGFLYYTDSAIGIIDCYMSNPASDPEKRNDALNQITDKLIENAVFHKCRMIKCDTQLDVISKRAKTFGFKSVGFFESFILEL